MRRSVLATLVDMAGRDDRILLLTADLGYTVLEPFAEAYPDRFFNVGVAEQNMIGLATGLAQSGLKPYCYSMATFSSLRPYEFIRNGPVFHRLPVRIFGVGGGFEYGPAGFTHYGLEDVGVMRLQPDMTVLVPADHRQAAEAVRITADLPGPIYFRLGKDDQRTVPGLEGRFRLGCIDLLRQGKEFLLLTMGPVAGDVLKAAEILQARDISATVASVATLNPAPVEDLRHLLAAHRLVLTVEAHFRNGGLGSMVAEIIAEESIPCRLHRIGVAATPRGRIGKEAFMNDRYGLSGEKIAATLLTIHDG